MNNLHDRFIKQLDSLIPFIGISREDVFNLIQKKKLVWFPESSQAIPDKYESYRKQINHSAFVLGYSYFEAFLSDLIKGIYLKRASMLPKEKSLKFIEIINAGNYETILEILIKKEIYELFYKNIEEIIKYHEDKLNLIWSKEGKENLVKASYLRNCIIHNMGIADDKLSKFSEYIENEPFELSSDDVHSFGILGRKEARNLWEQAKEKHLENV